MKWLRGLSPIARVFLGLALGALLGVFVGEPAGALSIGGDIYIRLLQMTVLPYVLVSLMVGLGGLDAEMARRIGLRGVGMILMLWALTLAILVCLPLAYPNWTSAAFFSTSLIEEPARFDPLTLYIPANPFYSLSHTLVPAVVDFSIMVGLALIAVYDKRGLLKGLSNISDALMKIASFVGKLAPIGIFAISASAAGTLRIEELSRLQVFLWVYLAAWCMLAFWVLPALVAWATPFSYREVLRDSQVAMVTAFATGTVLVVLPMIAEGCKALLQKHSIDSTEGRTTIDVLTPTAYSFPSVGTLLGLGFVLFAAWYVGTPLSISQYPSFALMGAFTAFGSMAVAIPFMLDFFSLSADLFQLYLLGSVVTARFATAMAAMHGVVVCLLTVTAVMGRLRLRALLHGCGIGIAVTAAALFLLGLLLARAIPYAYTGEETVVSMKLYGEPVPARQVEAPEPLSTEDRARSRLDLISARGALRVGYVPERLPYAFRSSAGEVVGFDLDLAHQIAREIGVGLELIRIGWEESIPALEDGRLDMVVGGIAVTPKRAAKVAFSRPYLDKSLGFAVLDYRRDEFPSLESMKSKTGLRVLLYGSDYYREVVAKLLPNVEIISDVTPRSFFRREAPDIDLMAVEAEGGAAWTLIYPDFSVIVPSGVRVKGSSALALPVGQEEFSRFVDAWIDVSIKSGLIEQLERYWIHGRDDGRKPPRWSILGNVLGRQESDGERAPGAN
ncbi:MAG: cation:dicarboxylase symporter family transporter [Deltaproteobacteria bacterium]|jgi:Na+/H+-dicarboxylate symporter|nr:cation:dicarboxylase symporter family transporter [Deltaproteobacteria bacterium]